MKPCESMSRQLRQRSRYVRPTSLLNCLPGRYQRDSGTSCRGGPTSGRPLVSSAESSVVLSRRGRVRPPRVRSTSALRHQPRNRYAPCVRRAGSSILVVSGILALSCCFNARPRPAGPVLPPNPMGGVIVSLDEYSLTIEDPGGQRWIFTNADRSVSITHLEAHQAAQLAVQVSWERMGMELVATQITDASGE